MSKTIIITGASRGIGFAISKALSKDSNKLHLVASSKKSFKVNDTPGACLYGFDLSKQENISILGNEIKSHTNHLDVLVNNMGVYKPKKFEEYSVEEINNMIDVNFRFTVLLTKELLPLIKKSESPHIIFISSMGARSQIIGESIYSATKAAITKFAEVLRNEYRNKIKVSVIHPWGVNTFNHPDVNRFLKAEDIAEGVDYIISRNKYCSVDSLDFGNIGQWRGGEAPWSPKLD